MSMKRLYLFILGLLWWLTDPASVIQADTEIHPALESLQPISSRTAESAQGQVYPFGLNENPLLPVGFSPEGLFAYVLDYANGGCGYCPQVVVTNLLNDEEVAEQLYVGEFDKAQASALLFGWGIQDLADKKMRLFPAEINGDHYQSWIRDGKLWLSSRRRGQKQVADLGTLQDTLVARKRSDILIEGFLVSPFEERIVILLSGLYLGFEGETDLHYFTVGAHLDKGFAPDGNQNR
jgi:hypothetical protein